MSSPGHMLCYTTINGTQYQLSDEFIKTLESQWLGYIQGMDAFTMACSSYHGGLCRPTAPKVRFSTKVFEPHWPPPDQIELDIRWTFTSEAHAFFFAFGVGHLEPQNGYSEKSVIYQLKPPDYTATISASTSYNDTLANVVKTIMETIPGVTLNTAYAKSPSPNVQYQVGTSDVQALDLGPKIAEFFCHKVVILNGGAAFLVDCFSGPGERIFSDFYHGVGNYGGGAWRYKSATAGGFTRPASTVYSYLPDLSVQAYHTQQSNIEDALDDILLLENQRRFRINVPTTRLGNTMIWPGTKITYYDNRLRVPTTTWLRARVLRMDLIKKVITVEGNGEDASS